MSFPQVFSLSQVISGLVANLTLLSERTLELDATCQMLEAQCASLQTQVLAAQSHIEQDKSAQRRLRADVAAFLRERGESRSSVNSSRVMEPGDISAGSNGSMDSVHRVNDIFDRVQVHYLEDSPLVLRSKRKGVQLPMERLEGTMKRRRLASGSTERRSLLERLS